MRKVKIAKTGDTLIEVTIAVGIFSMVAIAIVSVMNSGISNSQNSLETTLAREEIDTQAEALRFIHSAYVADMNDDEDGNASAADERYVELWDKITNKAVKMDEITDADKNIITGAPQSCSSLYNENFFKLHAFIINPRRLGYGGNWNDTLILPDTTILSGGLVMRSASSYPRLVYNSNQLNNNNSLDDEAGSNDDLYRAEGMYVFAVRDNDSTKLIGDNTIGGYTGSDDRQVVAENTSAFYDFYIRSCWYGNGDDSPDSVATIVRLYDPQSISTAEKSKVGILRYYSNSNGSATGSIQTRRVLAGSTAVISDNSNGFYYGGRTFLGWNTKSSMDGDTISWIDGRCQINNGATSTALGGAIRVEGNNCIYAPAANMDSNSSVGLYAMWNVPITATLSWGADPRDLDAHVWGTLSNGSTFEVKFGHLFACDGEEWSPSCRFKPAELSGDVQNGFGPEKMTINTVAGKNLYYYVQNWTYRDGDPVDWRRSVTPDPTVTISSPLLGSDVVVNQRDASGSGQYWNVFAVIDDEIVVCSHLTDDSPDTWYTEPCESTPDPVEDDGVIVYDGNSATSGSMGEQSISGASSLSLNPNTYSRINYEFAGWNTEPDGSGTSFSDGDRIDDLSGHVVLYAQWDPVSPTFDDFNVNDCKRSASDRPYRLRDTRTNLTFRVRYDSATSSCWVIDKFYYSHRYYAYPRPASYYSTDVAYAYCAGFSGTYSTATSGLSYCTVNYTCPLASGDCESSLLDDYPSNTICPAGWNIPLSPPGDGSEVLRALTSGGGYPNYWLSSYNVRRDETPHSSRYISYSLTQKYFFSTNYTSVRVSSTPRGSNVRKNVTCTRSN